MKIKTISLSLLLLLPSYSFGYASCQCDPCSDDDYTAQSFMFTKPIMDNLPAHNSAWHSIVHQPEGDKCSSLQIFGIFQQSMEHAPNARYFLFDHKTCLKVVGDTILESHPYTTRDIRAEWFGLPPDFSGGFSICPKQRKMGVLFEYNQKLRNFFESSLFENYWISVSAPLVSVENNLNLKQFDIQNPGTGSGPRDILDALCQDEWMYGKLCTCPRSDLQLAYIKLKLGSTYMSENNFQLAYYSQLLLSTAPRDCGKYMFDAVVGTNGHHGLGTGVNFQIVINRENPKYDVCIFADLEHIYLFRLKQMRTLDIKGKPWSRYMLFNQKDRGPDLNLAGVNVLTREVVARPDSMVDFTFGCRVKTASRLEVEVGYGIWGHGDECLELVCPFPEIYGIAGEKSGNSPTTASTSTIGTRETNDVDENNAGVFTPVLQEDLCLKYQGNRSAINHRVHLALSAVHAGENVDGTLSAGVFYEIPQRNSALKVWGLWGKVAASF